MKGKPFAGSQFVPWSPQNGALLSDNPNPNAPLWHNWGRMVSRKRIKMASPPTKWEDRPIFRTSSPPGEKKKKKRSESRAWAIPPAWTMGQTSDFTSPNLPPASDLSAWAFRGQVSRSQNHLDRQLLLLFSPFT